MLEMTLSWSLKYKWDFALKRCRSRKDIPDNVCKERWCTFLKATQSYLVFQNVFIEHLLCRRHVYRDLGTSINKTDKDCCLCGAYPLSAHQGCCPGSEKIEQPHLHVFLSGWMAPLPRQLSLTMFCISLDAQRRERPTLSQLLLPTESKKTPRKAL